MKAMVLTKVGAPLEMMTLTDPIVTGDSVIVDVIAAALNRRDLYITQGLYPGIETPAVLGSDAVGLVQGKRVVIQPGLRWGNDEHVQAAEYEVLGMPTNGTLAEHVVVPSDNVYACPNHLTDVEAAALPLAGLTAYRALVTKALAGNAASAGKPKTVVVTGAGGGVATFAIQFAAALGHEVYVTSSADEKIAFAKTIGAKGGVKYTDTDWTSELRELTGGIDAVVDGAGGQGLTSLTKLMRPGGRLAFYGGTTGSIPKLSPQLLFWRQLTLCGSTMGSPREFAAMLALVSKYEVRPVVDSVSPLSEANDALEKMNSGNQTGKLVLRI